MAHVVRTMADAITTCTGCAHLEGQPTSVKPHRMMLRKTQVFRGDGLLAQFKCRCCGRYWERFSHDPSYHGEAQIWCSSGAGRQQSS